MTVTIVGGCKSFTCAVGTLLTSIEKDIFSYYKHDYGRGTDWHLKGLGDVVKSQLSCQHKAHEVNRQKIEALAKTVSDLASNSMNTSSINTLKLPQVVLPRYTGKPEEQLDCLLDQLTSSREMPISAHLGHASFFHLFFIYFIFSK